MAGKTLATLAQSRQPWSFEEAYDQSVHLPRRVKRQVHRRRTRCHQRSVTAPHVWPVHSVWPHITTPVESLSPLTVPTFNRAGIKCLAMAEAIYERAARLLDRQVERELGVSEVGMIENIVTDKRAAKRSVVVMGVGTTVCVDASWRIKRSD